MKSLRLIIAILLIGFSAGAYAQDTKLQTPEGDKTPAPRSTSSSSGGVTRSGSSSSNSGNSGVSKRQAGNNKRGKKDDKSLVSDRQQSFYEVREPSDADLQWMKVIYRSIDLTKGKNAALLYPEMPNEDGENLYFIIMRLLSKNQITAYEYLPGGTPVFTDEYKVKVNETFDRFYIYYTEAKAARPRIRSMTLSRPTSAATRCSVTTSSRSGSLIPAATA